MIVLTLLPRGNNLVIGTLKNLGISLKTNIDSIAMC